MSDLPTRRVIQRALRNYQPPAYTDIVRAYADGDLLSREEAANAMMTFLDQHGGDVGQHWPTMEDALAWLGADDE